jgi:cell wall-associated NlpC family hydrolase
MTKLQIANKIAWESVGTFYRWGGDDPSGFDCSGLIVEILKSVGLIGRDTDYTANGLSKMFTEVGNPSNGCLIFWGNGSKITHVEFCIDEFHTIGASGGGSKTITQQDAIDQNAYIKVRPIRPGYVKIVNPF